MIIVRPGAAADIDGVVALEAGPDTAGWLGETGQSWHLRVLTDPDAEHLVATGQATGRATGHDSDIAGFAVLAGLHRPDQVIELRRMVIAAERRGAGLGRRLLRAAVARAYEHHAARRVWLDVKDGNVRAQALYESEGFVVDRTPAGTPVAVESGGRRFIIMIHDGIATTGLTEGAERQQLFRLCAVHHINGGLSG
jgi:ribosomal protein S18 acetylase RimI-like enzyme